MKSKNFPERANNRPLYHILVSRRLFWKTQRSYKDCIQLLYRDQWARKANTRGAWGSLFLTKLGFQIPFILWRAGEIPYWATHLFCGLSFCLWFQSTLKFQENVVVSWNMAHATQHERGHRNSRLVNTSWCNFNLQGKSPNIIIYEGKEIFPSINAQETVFNMRQILSKIAYIIW